MANINQVSFTDPYSLEADKIRRQQALAMQLQQQADTPIDNGRMVSGYYVPTSPLSHLAQALKGVNARGMMEKAENDLRDLGERRNTERNQTLAAAMKAMTGTPASSETIVDEQARGGEGAPAQINSPAVGANPLRGYEILAGAKDPSLQATGMAQMMDHLKSQRLVAALQGGQGGGQGAMPGMGGPAGGVPMQAWLASDPSGKSYLAQLAKDNQPVALREGDYIQRTPNGVQVLYSQPKVEAGMEATRDPQGRVTGAAPLPGYAQGRAQIAGAVEGAKQGAQAEADVITVPDGRGGTVQMRRADYLRILQGAAPQGAPPEPQPVPRGTINTPGFVPGNQGLTAEVQGTAPTEQAAMDAVRQAASQGRGASVYVQPPLGQKGPQLPEAAVKAQQEELDAIATAAGIKTDLGVLLQQIQGGQLKLGPISNITSAARNYAGASNQQSQNFATFRATLERLRNDSLRLNKGIQTEGDAQRAWNELMNNITDEKVVAKRLAEIQALNDRAVGIRRNNISTMRGEHKLGPLDTSQYENLPSTVGAGGPKTIKWDELP